MGLRGREAQGQSASDPDRVGTTARRIGCMAVTVAVIAVVMGLTSGGATGATPTSVRATSGAAPTPTSVKAFMTLYGFVDNSPPGAGIAHPCVHSQAGGTGTYADPITFATDVAELGWCAIIYVPYMERYFIHEDECSECDRDWNSSHLFRFDMWAGGDSSSLTAPERRALIGCERTWTRANSSADPANPAILVNPQPDLAVTTNPIFSPPTSCWSPITISNTGKQTSYLNTGPVKLPVAAADTAPGQTLAFSAVGLPNGLSIDPLSGLVSVTPAVKGSSRVTVTASDTYNSATIRFVWVVKSQRRH